ncbi:MAG: hypothetical protein WBG86_08845 [Polyangiales bacterium]
MVHIKGCGERWDRVGATTPGEWRTAANAVSRGSAVIASPGAQLEWLDEPCTLAVARETPGSTLGIRIRAYTLVLLDADAQLLKTLPLAGATAGEVADWLARQGFTPGHGRDFPPTPNQAVLGELDRTMSNVHEMLGYISRRTQGAGAVRSNPATLETCVKIRLSSREGESPRTIELGFTLDGDQGELFVRTEPGFGFQALRLPISGIAAMSDVDAQAPAVERFFQESLGEAYASLRRQWQSRRPSAPV